MGFTSELWCLCHWVLRNESTSCSILRIKNFFLVMSSSDETSPTPTLQPTEERTLHFEGDNAFDWDIDPVFRVVTYTGILRTAKGPSDEPRKIITERTTLHFRLPWEWMWTAFVDAQRTAIPAPVVAETPQCSSRASGIPPPRRRGARFLHTARKRVAGPPHTRQLADRTMIPPTSPTPAVVAGPALPTRGTTFHRGECSTRPRRPSAGIGPERRQHLMEFLRELSSDSSTSDGLSGSESDSDGEPFVKCPRIDP